MISTNSAPRTPDLFMKKSLIKSFYPKLRNNENQQRPQTPGDSCVSSLHTSTNAKDEYAACGLKAGVQSCKSSSVNHEATSYQTSDSVHSVTRAAVPELNMLFKSTTHSGQWKQIKEKIRSSGEGEEIAHRSIRFNGPRGAAAADSHQPRRYITLERLQLRSFFGNSYYFSSG